MKMTAMVSSNHIYNAKWFIVCALFILSDASPINKDEINFDDNWDYRIEPHNIPLLDKSLTNHLLPTTYEYEKDLKVRELHKEKSKVRESKKLEDVVRTTISCGVCKLGVGLLDAEIKNGSSFELIREKFVSLCVSFQIETEPVCRGFFNVYGPEVLPAYKASGLGPADICKLVFGESCDDPESDRHEWYVEIPGQARSLDNNEIDESEEKMRTVKVLQLSDIHYDPEYKAGSVANCEEPLCCRSYSTPPIKGNATFAGKWGAYNKCDSPKELIENMLKHIALQHPDIDFILWTGDLVPHDIWNQTKEGNMDIIKETVRQMNQYFPNTPIFPAIGNHESVPAGNFAPPWMKNEEHSIDWLYKSLSDHWRRWLPATTGTTVMQGGFYSVLLRPGFRLISVNTNYCYSISWWLLVNSTDPAKQLKWLTYELQNAEDKGEKIHLIGHVPPGSSDCLKSWSRNFNRIVERFKDTIVAQYYGHTHADEFEVFYDTKKLSEPVNIAYIAPSMTTFENHNPAYRIYYISDGSGREVLDHETWTIDLEKANEEEQQPIWYKLYSAKDAYMLKSLSPKEWNGLIKRMTSDEELFDLFYKNYYRDSPARPTCDSTCKLQILCDLKTARSQERKRLCQDLV